MILSPLLTLFLFPLPAASASDCGVHCRSANLCLRQPALWQPIQHCLCGCCGCCTAGGAQTLQHNVRISHCYIYSRYVMTSSQENTYGVSQMGGQFSRKPHVAAAVCAVNPGVCADVCMTLILYNTFTLCRCNRVSEAGSGGIHVQPQEAGKGEGEGKTCLIPRCCLLG